MTNPDGTVAPVYYVDSEQNSDLGLGGWSYDDPASPTKVRLCPGACSMVTAASFNGSVDIALGCDRLELPK